MAPDDETVKSGDLNHPDEPVRCAPPKDERIEAIILEIFDRFPGQTLEYIQNSVNFRIQQIPGLTDCQVSTALIECVLKKHGRIK